MWRPFENVNLLYFLLKIQIWNGCNVVNIAGNPIKDINVNLSFLSSRWKVVEWKPPPPEIGKIFNFISEFRIKSCGIYPKPPTPPQDGYQVEIWENLLFHVLSNDACKFAINLFPIMWGPFENVNLLYFLLKIQIWNGCNVLNIAGNPIKDINVNLSFLSSRWKVVECTPQRLEKFLTSFLSSGSKVVEYTPQAGYQVEIWENLLFHVLSNDACKFAINLFPIMWGPFENVNLLYFLLKIQIWNGCNVVNIAGNPIKDINVNLSFLSSRWKSCWMKTPIPQRLEKFLTSQDPQDGYQVEIWENLLFHILSNDACKFAINLFPIMWGPFENVNLLYFLLKIQISNGCNVINIAGNPIKDINVNLSFLSSRWKVVEWKPPPPRDWKNF